MRTYKGYNATVEFDEQANVLFGTVSGLRDVVTFEATSVGSIEAEFHRSVDDYLAMCNERGERAERAYSGRFILRVGPALHRELALAAEASGVSLNAHVIALLSPAPATGGTTPDVAKLIDSLRRMKRNEMAPLTISERQTLGTVIELLSRGAPVRAMGEGTDTEAALQEAFCDGVAYAANTMSDSLDDAKQEARSRYTARSTPPSPPVTE